MSKARPFSLFCLFLFFLLAPFPASSPAMAKVKIVATIFPLYEMAREVGGEKVKVHLLVPPGAEPHSFEPRPSDLRKVASAKLVLMVGAGLDNWVEDILRAVKTPSSGKSILKLGNGAHLINVHHDHHNGGTDPHVWLDFKWNMKFATRLIETLSGMDPDNAAYYAEHGRLYIKRLQALDAAFETGLKECRTRTFVVGGHGAFGYLARAYGLEQLSLYGISSDSRPTPKKMVQLAKKMQKLGITTIFFEGTVSSKLAQVLSRETGAKVSTLYTGASLTKRQIENSTTFISLMYENLKNLRQGLGCK